MKQPRRLARQFFAAGDMMATRSDSETSRHYLDGLPQTHLPAFGLTPNHCGRFDTTGIFQNGRGGG
jgi:hypothetical protein